MDNSSFPTVWETKQKTMVARQKRAVALYDTLYRSYPKLIGHIMNYVNKATNEGRYSVTIDLMRVYSGYTISVLQTFLELYGYTVYNPKNSKQIIIKWKD